MYPVILTTPGREILFLSCFLFRSSRRWTRRSRTFPFFLMQWRIQHEQDQSPEIHVESLERLHECPLYTTTGFPLNSFPTLLMLINVIEQCIEQTLETRQLETTLTRMHFQCIDF